MFFIAYLAGSKHITRYLIEKGADVNRKDSKFRSLLSMSVKNNDLEFTEYLLNNRADVNLTHENDRTALMLVQYI